MSSEGVNPKENRQVVIETATTLVQNAFDKGFQLAICVIDDHGSQVSMYAPGTVGKDHDLAKARMLEKFARAERESARKWS